MKRTAKLPDLHLSVQYGCEDDALADRSQIRRWCLAAQETAVQVTVRFVDAREGRTLNRDFRGKDYATNVLTFIYETTPVVGDLVVCIPVVKREAKAQKKTFRDHLAHMIVHGMLHLQGYDHETGTDDAETMEQHERDILARFRIADPYA